MGRGNWRERRLAWFIGVLAECWESIPHARSGESPVTLNEWCEATGLDTEDFHELYDLAWEDNLFSHSQGFQIRFGVEELVSDGYAPTQDGYRFIGFIGREGGGERYRKQPIPDELRWAVWERDNFTCQHCGSRQFLSVDHIFAESRGGTMTLDNLQTLCKTCNSRKGAR